VCLFFREKEEKEMVLSVMGGENGIKEKNKAFRRKKKKKTLESLDKRERRHD